MKSFFVELFLTGLAMGWGPCIASSAVMLPYFAGTKRSWRAGLKAGLTFSFGRITAYIALGAIAGFSGQLLSTIVFISDVKYRIEVGGGIFIVFLGLTIILGGLTRWKVCDFIHRWDHGSIFVAGVLKGLLPCAPLVAVLSYLVLNAKNEIIGGLGAAAFGLGTLLSPFLILAGISGYVTKYIVNEKIYGFIQRICGSIVIYLGIKTIISGLIMMR
ncbi:MAG: sulfite exporter TauE/SafE family protein [Elusimicrobiota bacterium]